MTAPTETAPANPFTRYAEEARRRGNLDAARTTETEGKIVRKLVEHALASGYTVSVNDGEDTVLHKSTDLAEIIDACASTDEDYLTFKTPEGGRYGYVRLIYGNGNELISDYSAADLDAFSAWIKPVEDYAEALR